MKMNFIINKDGVVQKGNLEFQLCISGGEAGWRAVNGLMVLIGKLNKISDPTEIAQHWFACCGYALCCIESGFLDDESTDKMMHTIGDLVVDDLIAMVKQQGGESSEETKGA